MEDFKIKHRADMRNLIELQSECYGWELSKKKEKEKLAAHIRTKCQDKEARALAHYTHTHTP